MKITKEMYKACDNALVIADGACNACGASNALNKAYLAWSRAGYGTGETNQNSAVKLMLHQICHLAKISTDEPISEYQYWIRRCKEMMTQYEEQEEARIQEVSGG